MWTRPLLRLLLASILVTHVAAQLSQKVTVITPGTTSWYPAGPKKRGDPSSSYTVRSDPPSGTVTITRETPVIEVVTDASGAEVTNTKSMEKVEETTVIDPPRAIPTLVYNCEYMPFICKNVENSHRGKPQLQVRCQWSSGAALRQHQRKVQTRQPTTRPNV